MKDLIIYECQNIISVILYMKSHKIELVKNFYDKKPTMTFVSCPDSKVEDEKAEFKKIIDNLVIYEFLQSEESKYNFLKLICSHFCKGVDDYNLKKNLSEEDKVRFVYKGGNLMRILKKRYFSDEKFAFMEKTGWFGNADFYDAFSKSDDDFTIKINPDDKDFDLKHEDMEYYTYVSLKNIRDIICKDSKTYFDFYKNDENVKKNILINKVLTPLQGISCTKNVAGNMSIYKGYTVCGVLLGNTYSGIGNFAELGSVEKFRPFPLTDKKPANLNEAKTQNYSSIGSRRSDFAIIPSSVQKNVTEIHSFIVQSHLNTPITFDTPPIYISHNDTLTFSKGDVSKASFTLLRSKLNVRIFLIGSSVDDQYYIDIGGELIDVSIPKKDDTEMQHFFSDISLMKKYIKTYTFNYTPTSDSFNMNGYTIDYMIEDLWRVLFTDSGNRPWTDSKFARRFSRIYILYMIKIFYPGDNVRPESLTEIEKNIAKYIKLLEKIVYKSETGGDIVLDLVDLKTIAQKVNVLGGTTNFVNDLFTIYANEYKRDYRVDKPNIDKCIEKIIQNLNFIGTVIMSIENNPLEGSRIHNISEFGNFDDSQVYEKNFGGDPYFRKYIKYKTKYLELKNSKNF